MNQQVSQSPSKPETVLYLPDMDKRYLLTPYKFYLEEARKRIFPPFADIEGEMKAHSEKWRQKAGQWFNPETDDEGSFTERAYDEGIAYGLMLDEMSMNVRLAVLAGLLHRWEKDLREWMVKELRHTVRHKNLKREIWRATIPSLTKLLDALGAEVTTQPHWPRLEAYCRVVNVYKHGDGPSLDALKEANPEYFGRWDPPLKRDWRYVDHSDMHITEEQFDELADTVTNFWKNIPERITKDDQKSKLPDWFAKLNE